MKGNPTSDNKPSMVEEVTGRIKPMLSGLGLDVQGAVLADLVSIWLGDHVHIGDADVTNMVRGEVLRIWLNMVHDLVRMNDDDSSAPAGKPA
ncbi:MAG: hypothetical protein WA192_04040 [Candidatus Acidiferrales bacterium]